MNARRLLARAETIPEGLRFAEPTALAESFGFRLERISGSHHIDRHPIARRTLNLQPHQGMAKAYQVRQLLKHVREAGLSLADGDA